MNGEKESFLEELELLMRKYDVTQLSYTINDDGIWAHRNEGESWHLGWVQS